MKITRKGIAAAVEGTLLTKKKFVHKAKDVIYIGTSNKTSVMVAWIPRWRKV